MGRFVGFDMQLCIEWEFFVGVCLGKMMGEVTFESNRTAIQGGRAPLSIDGEMTVGLSRFSE